MISCLCECHGAKNELRLLFELFPPHHLLVDPQIDRSFTCLRPGEPGVRTVSISFFLMDGIGVPESVVVVDDVSSTSRLKEKINSLSGFYRNVKLDVYIGGWQNVG
jgi:hypothetical protein